ncbi:uncharacterized protein LOC123533706 [Mercenaria mercenaria]|uniref:uncharacterized protein LOC123533706 n=1 Tax=Mercenaria mercenaria TaxID=6596 RepID=UPI00234FADCD|nr:uncharacterized protein LOC123533706 [Mercenaria mercenaria]XP_045171427.2 uncharacterized protein LOC123533706 [Mercenaria mercenaria]XP_045171428.2 uncharacterized protein LOC123533706 [Mercenaria mercenaria]XP_045171429.2 uncharacterized protein LOC123533706 [Mercenaria mercenaria]XP_045171431.2 uncharacterized protein LOC123533706 [Mercenaria mercenaria]XP_053376265.1 uncharacterized protein LOC123533706 [Mercenaria mercenaria]XP_053376266.1 uncharacterized protein LOC123533706 [Mercen
MMSIITKQPTEFHDQPCTNSSTTIHNSPPVQEELEKKVLNTSNYTPYSSFHNGKSICESFQKDDDKVGELYQEDKEVCESYNKEESIGTSYHKDKNIFDCYYTKVETSKSQHENENLHESTRTLNTTENVQVSGQDKTSSLNHTSYSSHSKIGYDNHPVLATAENGTSLLKDDNQPKTADVNTEVNLLFSKQETTIQNSCPSPLSSFGKIQNSVDNACEKQFDTALSEAGALSKGKETINGEFTSLKPSELTSLISSQRERILKKRREDRLSEEKTTDTKPMHEKRERENMSFEYKDISENKKKPSVSSESKSASKEEKSKHKKKKKLVDHGGFNDIFSEPLNVKDFYSIGSKKRERKLPSKFIYLSKMEKFLSCSPKSKHKKKYKPRCKQSEELSKKIKVEADENVRDMRNETEERKDINKIKIFTIKAENKQQINTKKQNKNKDSHFSSSGKNTPSKSFISFISPESSKKSQLLRDSKFQQHCLRRHYRLKSSNWNCSSRSALWQLRRKYNSINLLFEREPIVCLTRLKLEDTCLTPDISAGETEGASDCRSGLVTGNSVVKSETVTFTDKTEIKRPMQDSLKVSIKFEQDSEVYNQVFNARQKEVKTETKDLVDPRVMSLSKTLQSTNNGKVGLEKIFKNCYSKPGKSKKKENSKSHGRSVKKKVKPDWSKWKEKLKEASNKMVERRKGGLVVEKNINRFPSAYVNISPPSILNFRIPLKSNNKGKNEENTSPDAKGKENAANTEIIPSDIPRSECLELNKNTDTEIEDESKVLKEINEELTLEEYETDRFITYSINGYSIEISRDSPIDTKMNEDKSSAENECFDEDEMNKILYGDNFDDVRLDCQTRNNQEYFNETDAGLTVTSDIIPNLYAQDENIFRESGDFSDEIDKSPPVLEKSSLSAENSDIESENFYIVHENKDKQASEYLEAESEQQKVTDEIRKDNVHSDEAESKTIVVTKADLISANTNNEEVEISCDGEGYGDVNHDITANKTLTSDEFSEEDLLKRKDIKKIPDTDEDECCDPSPFVIENVCSLSETQLVSEHSREQEADLKIDVSVNENEQNCTCWKDNGEIDKSRKDPEGSLEQEEFSKQDSMDNEISETVTFEENTGLVVQEKVSKEHSPKAIGLVSANEADTCIASQGSSYTKCDKMNLKLQDLSKTNISLSNKTDELPQANKSENLFETNSDEDVVDPNDFDRTEGNNMVKNEIRFESNTDTLINKIESKKYEKSAAAVMEDLEKMWKEMKSKSDGENISLKHISVDDKGDNSDDGVNCINGKLSEDSADIEKCYDGEQSIFETITDVPNPQKEKKSFIKDTETCKTEDIDCDLKETAITDDKGYNKIYAHSDLSIETTMKSSTLDMKVKNTKETDQNIFSNLSDFHYEKSNEQSCSFDAMSNTEMSDSSEDTDEEAEKESIYKKFGETYASEGESEMVDNRKMEDGRRKKRKISKDNYSSSEKAQSSSDDNMEQNEERIMCDFPNHNWLFNKYNISDVRVEKEIVKDVKSKKQKKDDKDTIKPSEVKSRRKSSSSTANILPTQRKLSTNKSHHCPESQMLQKADKSIKGNTSPEHKSIKIKWNKTKKRSSLSDSSIIGEKINILAEKDDYLPCDKTSLSSKYFGGLDCDTLSLTNLQETANNDYAVLKKNEYNKSALMSPNHNDICKTAANLLTKTKQMDINMDFLKTVSGDKSLNSDRVDDVYLKSAQKSKIPADIASGRLNDSIFIDKAREEIKDSESVGRMLFGDVTDDDDDDEEKLEIDETACTEDVSSEDKVIMLNLQHTDSDDQISKFEESSKKSVLVRSPGEVNETETDTLKLTVEETLVAEPSTTSSIVVSKPDKRLATEVTALISEVKSADAVTVKNTVTNRFEAGVLDGCAVKSEAGSISFRPRTKPPVQLVHPQVHKPPAGKIKVESVVTSEIPTNVSVHTGENKEESATTCITTTNVVNSPVQADAGLISTLAQISPVLDTTVTSTASGLLSTALVNSGTPQAPVTVLPTLAQISNGGLTVTTTSPSSFGNGMVIPIQPFVQNVPNALQQGYVQSIPQLQPSLVQIQSQNIDPLFQQSSPVHIQNQLIPVTIYQAGNQTLISNYTYTNAGSQLRVSSQSANVIQAQPVNFNMNQTQLNTSSVRMPLCRPVNSGPPPLLILPKPSNLSSLNEQCKQSQYLKKEISSLKNQKQKCEPSKVKNNSSGKNHCQTFKQKTKQFSSNGESCDSISESVHRPPSDSEKMLFDGTGNVEEEVDDEIKKQMEELDREIKQKEQEQEEMRRKKLELLEKMKQAKSIIKKETEAEMTSKDKCEIDKGDKEKPDEDRKEISESAEDASEVVETGLQKTPTDTEEAYKERKRSCKDMVLSEVIEEENDDVFDSDAPIDLSSALKSSQVNDFSKANLSVTVSNGIISIKENNNIESSLVHSSGNLETENEGGESEFDCMDDDNSVLNDNYPTVKCDGINYIEDIGLVNPFTGEYEINEDVEGVEYLDLSTKPDECSNDHDRKDIEDSGNGKDMESAVSKDRNEDTNIDSNLKVQTDKQDVTEKVEEESAEENSSISSEKPATKKSPISISIINPVSSETDTINQPLIVSLPSSMTSVSVTSSSIPTMSCSVAQFSSVAESEFSKSADAAPAITTDSILSAQHCDINVGISEESFETNNCETDDVPLNLEKVKPTTSLVTSGVHDVSDVLTKANTDNTPNTHIDTNTQSMTQSPTNLRERITESEVTNFKPQTSDQSCNRFPRKDMNLGSVQENQTHAADKQVPSLPVAADKSLLQMQLSSPKRHSSLQKVMRWQDKQVLAQGIDGTVNLVDANQQIVNKQNYKMNSSTRNSREMLKRRVRQKYMELKPAHYRSPPRKVQRGEKQQPAHNQKPTSRETMKKMCKTPFIHPHVVHKTSPYICRKHPIFLSPKEVEKPFPRLWEKRPPKSAHSKRPFGIAGHLIVQSSRKYRKRAVSGELASPPRFYSLPNTPTATSATPPRATSADFHSSYSPLQSPTEVQGPSNTSTTSASPNKTGDHHGAQVGLPSPIRAHCRPKSMMTCNQFYETSVLRPPALLRNPKAKGESPGNDVIEVIDLTADIPPTTRSDSAPKSTESPRSKERAIQKELSHAVSKRQKLDNTEASSNERGNCSSQNSALRQQQLLSQIVARQRLMPPPPYTGRQRMPVLVQVPRQPTLEHHQRMPYNRRVEPQLNDNQRHIAQNMVQPDMQRFQKPSDLMQVNDSQIRPQMYPSQYMGPAQDTRTYGGRVSQTGVHTQDYSSGNDQLIQNQDVGPLRRVPQQMMYPAGGTMQTANSAMTGYVGNPRMQHPGSNPANSMPQQQVYPIRSQNMPYTTTQNQTQIHQLLQQPQTSSLMMQRGDPNTQMMQRGEISHRMIQRGEICPQVMQRGEISPHMMQRGEISPQVMQRGEVSPQVMQRGEISPQMMQRGEISPHVMQRGERSPQLMQRGELSPQIMQRGEIGPQMMQRGEIGPQMMQRGEISPQLMQRGERSPQLMQRGERSPQLMQRGEVSPQIIQGGVTSPQMIMNGNPQVMQRGMSTQMIQSVSTSMPAIPTQNIQMMPTGEINQNSLYSVGNGSQMMHASNTSPHVISPTGILAQAQMMQNTVSANGYQRSQMQSDKVQGPSSAVQPTITPQRLQRMQLIRAQHIRSQQLQSRGAQAGFEQGTRMPSTLNPHVGIDQSVQVVNSSAGPQQMTGYNTGMPHQKRSHLQASAYPQQMAALEPQVELGMHPPQQVQQGLESGNKGPPAYPVAGSQTQTMLQQTHFHQTGIQNNMNTMQQNNFVQRPAVYISNQSMQVPQSKPVPSYMNVSQHNQNIQGQGHIMTQIPSGMVSMSQGRQVQCQVEYNNSQVPANMTVVPGGQMMQDHNTRNVSDRVHNYQSNKAGQFQNQNWRAQVQNSEQLQAVNVTKKGQKSVTQQKNTAQLHAVSSVNIGKNVLLGDGSGQQNIDKTKDLIVVTASDTEPANVIPHTQSAVAMTTNQIITQSTTPVVATNQIHQSADNNTQVSPSGSKGQSEGQVESKVTEEEELPHLQQVHGECVMCGKYSLYLCSNCKKIWYCSPECQLTHWQTHANECEGQVD